MGKSNGDDLRRKLLEAHDRGEGTLDQLATRFSPVLPWAWRISAQRRHSGAAELIEQLRGSRRKVTPEVEQRLGGWIEAQPDLTLAELQQKLEQAVALHVSVGRLWQGLLQVGLGVKKNRFTASDPKPGRNAK